MTQILILLGCFDWDCHYASAPYESPMWASTDRGWVGLINHPDNPAEHDPCLSRCVGNYLRYDRPNEHGQHYHACAYIFRRDSPLLPTHCVHLGACWTDTQKEAQDWIEETITRYLQGLTTKEAA